MSLTLYSFRRCPYSIRARLVLHLCGLSYDTEEVSLKNKPQSLLDISPKGTVPVLDLGQRVIDESMAIVFWALNQRLPHGWEPLSTHDETFAQALHQKLHKVMIPSLNRYKYPDRHQAVDSCAEQALWLAFMKEINAQLSASGFLVGNTCSWLDISILPFIRQLKLVDVQWFESVVPKKLDDWLNQWLVSEAFMTIMEKH